MYHLEMRYQRIIHVLPEERLVVQSIERYSVGAHTISNGRETETAAAHSLSRSNCDFFGMISSICGASKG